MAGEFFWLRTEQSILTRFAGVNATALTSGADNIFDSAQPAPFVFENVSGSSFVAELKIAEEEYVWNMRDREVGCI